MSDFLIILLFTVTRSEARDLTRYDQNTCFNKTASVYYCCSDFEEINYKCIECKSGFNSRNGKACEPCLYGLFGKGCSRECICNDLQRCDNVEGCVDVEITGTQETITGVHKNEESDGTGISKTELLMLYSAALSGIFVILGVLGALYCFKRRTCKSKSKRVELIEEEVRNAAEHLQQDTFELHERLYEEIDESKLESILHPQTCSPNLAKDECSSSSGSKRNCNLHTTNKSYRHENENIEKAVSFGKKSNKSVVGQSFCSFSLVTEEDSSSSESIEDYNINRGSYLHPYNTLSAKRSYSHTYERTNTAVQSTKESN